MGEDEFPSALELQWIVKDSERGLHRLEDEWFWSGVKEGWGLQKPGSPWVKKTSEEPA